MDLATIERLDGQGWKVDSLYLDTRHGTVSLHTRFGNAVASYRTFVNASGVQVEVIATGSDAITLKEALARIDRRLAELDVVACAGRGSSTCATMGVSEVRS